MMIPTLETPELVALGALLVLAAALYALGLCLAYRRRHRVSK